MKKLIFLLFMAALIPFLSFSENLKLVFTDGDVFLLKSGVWTDVDEGTVVTEKDQLKLSSNSRAVVQGQEVKLYLNNTQKTPKVFSLEKTLAEWKNTSQGQNAIAARLDKLVGGKVSRDTANMGVRNSVSTGSSFGGEPMGLDPVGPAPMAPGAPAPAAQPVDQAEELWTKAQAAIEAKQDAQAVDNLNKMVKIAKGPLLSKGAFTLANLQWKAGKLKLALAALDTAPELGTQKEGIFLYAQLYLDTQNWQSLNALADQKARQDNSSVLAPDQKQALIYIQSLGYRAQGLDPQGLYDQIVAIDPKSEWATLVSPPDSKKVDNKPVKPAATSQGLAEPKSKTADVKKTSSY